MSAVTKNVPDGEKTEKPAAANPNDKQSLFFVIYPMLQVGKLVLRCPHLTKKANKDETLLHINLSHIGARDFNAFTSKKFDAIILSKAGINSLKLSHLISQEFSTEEVTPSAGQGIISIQCREDDKDIIDLLSKVNNETSFISAKSERKVLRILEGDCYTPVGVFARVNNNNLTITGELFSIDGKKRYFKQITDSISNYLKASEELGYHLKKEAKDSYKK